MTATAMPTRPLRLPDSYGYTVDDLHGIPEDGRRYELIDGSIIVSPSVTLGHNTIAFWLAGLLWDSNPGDEYVVGTDQSANIDEHNEPRPDLVVARVRNLERSPFPITDTVLVGEVVSPSSGLRDRVTKRALYAAAGVPSYWLIEPGDGQPTISLTEFRLGSDDAYVRVADRVTGVFRTDAPWPLEIDVAALTERRARLMRLAARARPAAEAPATDRPAAD
jgi:Uma2 family endonuclease